MKNRHLAIITLGTLLLVGAAGCKKKTAGCPATAAHQPAPTQKTEGGPAAVINSFVAEPSTIIRGEASTLKWNVSNATEVTIDNNIGKVANNGTRQVFPTGNTTYRLTAKGPGGDAISAVTVAVTTPPPPPPPAPKAKISLSERMARDIQDVYFDYDKSEVREDARATLQRNADAMKAILNDYPAAVVTVEGHCDERGSAEYNLGLGDRRATSVREFLTQIGVPAERIKPVSYGKERPACTDASESCYQKNRRAHFAGVE